LDTYGEFADLKCRPLAEETLPVIPESDYLARYEYCFDGIWEPGQDAAFVSRPGTTLRFSRVLPGAVQRTVSGDFLPRVTVHSILLLGEELVLKVEATKGETWEVHAHHTMQGLAATGQTFEGQDGVQNLRV